MRSVAIGLLALSSLLAVTPALRADTNNTSNTLLIAPGDVIHVQVADTPEMEEHARVTDDGKLPVVGIEAVSVIGLSPEGAAQVIRQALINSHYLNHPQVLVAVDEYSTRDVSILGEVRNSGAFPVSRPRPVLDVLALAGGLTPIADRNILIERNGRKNEPIAYFVSNTGTEAFSSQVMVNPGDTIFVPRAGLVYILGDVNHPGAYALSNNNAQLSLLQGLALAGGLTKTAKEGQARLLRHGDDGQVVDTKFSIGDMQRGDIPDRMLKAGDILFVPFSFGRNLVVSGSSSITSSAASAAIVAAAP